MKDIFMPTPKAFRAEVLGGFPVEPPKRFWISWIQLTRDFRPLTDPPTKEVLGWWKSGEAARPDFDDVLHEAVAILCALVEANSEEDAERVVCKNWAAKKSEIGAFRFCEEKSSDWLPGNRFPVTTDWERERLGLLRRELSDQGA